MNTNLNYYLKMIICLSSATAFASCMGQAEASTVSSVTIYDVSSEVTVSNSGVDRAAIHIVDGSGLDAFGQHINNPSSLNINNAGGTMWDANTFDPSLTTGPTDTDPSITFNLGSEYTLTSLRVWNYNAYSYSPVNGLPWIYRGVKSVDISTSNNGSAFTDFGNLQFAQAPGTSDYIGEVIPFNVTTQFVRFHILSNYANDLTFGVGLSEVQFSAVPIPAAVWLFGSALAGLGLFSKGRSSRGAL